MRTLLLAFCCGLTMAGTVLQGQTPAAPAFDAASVKPWVQNSARELIGCRGGPGAQALPGRGDPGRWTCNGAALRDLVLGAYDILDYQLTRPDWLDSTRFSIVAAIPAGATREQFLLMQQDLLAKRFGLVVHHDSKEVAGFELTVAKGGPKLKEATPDELQPSDPLIGGGSSAPPGGRVAVDKSGFPVIPPGKYPPGAHIQIAGPRGVIRSLMLQETTDGLAKFFAYALNAPVVNATGLSGRYDIALDYVPRRPASPDSGASGDSAAEPGPASAREALEPQLGLRLVPKKVKVDVVVVDKCEREEKDSSQ